MMVHATTIGLLYAVGIGLATMLLYWLRNAIGHVHVWHVWAVTFVGFVLGYYFLPLDEFLAGTLGIDTAEHVAPIGFFRLLPIWFLLTYLIVQPYLNQSLRSELDRLREVNALLEGRNRGGARAGQSVKFASGRTEFALDADAIRNVVVDDHYCYVHYRDDDDYRKRDLALPLREIAALLPPDFVQVHRSHIVNLQHIASIKRKGRSICLTLDGDYEVPVSRHRLDTVLPMIRRQIDHW